ncbi:MAG: ribulose-phosphate 3-epimerase [Rikenellaceae bacterium]
MKKIISPSLLSADFLNLERDCQMVNRSAAQWFHLDIMDGNFVPNISYGMPVVEAIRRSTTKVLDVHLMIEKPERYIAEFKRCGADFLTVHAEATVHLHRTIQAIRAEGMKAGVALCPATSLSVIEEVLCDVDMVLLMSVNPGFGGQKFIPSTIDKIKRLRQMIVDSGSEAIIQIDGGVNEKNAAELFDAGAECLVAGSAVFGSADPIATIENMLK